MKTTAIVTAAILMLLALCCTSPDGNVSPRLAAILADTCRNNAHALPGDTAPDDGCTRLRSRRLPAGFGRVFNDLNDVHLEAARAAGIVPVEGPLSAWTCGKGIVEVRPDSTIYIDQLTHSLPFLTPRAADLLHEIGRRFNDSLDARGGGDYRIKLTSVLRTPQSAKSLRRVNRNASVESAHRYATTFDISYSKFICDNSRGTRRTFEDLKNLLAEIVYDLRCEGRCLVKHERRQACFHITVLPDSTISQ